MNIKLFCAVGMSTSMLVKKMQEAAKNKGIDAKIAAYSVNVFKDESKDADVILLGPQVSYMLNDLKSQTDKPIDVIPLVDYGMMNGEKVIDFALKLKG